MKSYTRFYVGYKWDSCISHYATSYYYGYYGNDSGCGPEFGYHDGRISKCQFIMGEKI